MEHKKRPPQRSSLHHSYTPDYNTTYDDIADFQRIIKNFGWQSRPVEPDTGICRGRTKRDKAFWAVLHSSPVVAGAYGSWKTGESYTWCAKSQQDLSPKERDDLKRQYREMKQRREQEIKQSRKQAQSKAHYFVSNACPAPADFPYLQTKQVKPHNALLYRGMLLVSLYDVENVLHSVQFIQAADGSKRFQKGARTKAVFHYFGKIDPTGTVYIAEGWATAATIFEWKHQATIAALNAGNLLPVAMAIKQKYPRVSLVIVADDDRFNKLGNVGKDKAEDCARFIGGSVLFPEFSPDSEGTDWNDLFVENGGKLP